jgi:glyoxalase superfamily protein
VALKLAAVTVDCGDALKVAQFWAAALDRPLDPKPSIDFASIGMVGHRDTEGWHLDGNTTWLFQRVAEPRTVKNRLHVDMATADPDAEVTRLVGLGATRVADMNEYGYEWIVMQDPEGNEFCIAQIR